MRHRQLVAVLLLTVIALLAPVSATAQTQLRVSWGDPDLQGIWTNETITPFERPAEMTGQSVMTAEQAAAIERRVAERRAVGDKNPHFGVVGSYNQFWMDSGDSFLGTRQTSLVVDPLDGRVPTRHEAEATRDDNRAHEGDSYVYMSVWDRCISRGVPGSMFPAGYNNAYQILQTPGYVTIIYEMIHDVRIIPLDERPHVNPNIRLWMGDSRGRWEGDTLVVETTNYHDRGWIASNAASARIKGIPTSDELNVVERFTRVDDDTIAYEATITDSLVYTAPWTVSMPLTRDPAYVFFEYACHEGNRAVENILSGARVGER